MHHLPIFLALSLAVQLRAQTDPRVFTPSAPVTTPMVSKPIAVSGDTGHVTIHESARISSLMKEYASKKQPLKGYRVQLFLGDRTKAEEIRRSFLGRHPNVPAYLSYFAPNFRVRVGDLRSKLPADKLRADLSDEFPGLYVVPDEIELPRLGTDK